MLRQRLLPKEDTKKLAIAVRVLQNTWNFVISHCCFVENGKEQNARAQPMFCSLNFFFGVAFIAVVVC